MQTIPEQISSAGRAQLQAQLELLNSIAVATVENTGKIAQFQLDASREALGRSYAAWSQLMTAGPSNLFQMMSKAQSNFASMFDTARAPFPAFSRDQPGTEARQEDASGQPSQVSAPEPHPPRAAATEAEPHNTYAEAEPHVSEPHAAQPPLHRTPIAEAASEIVPEGLNAVLAAAPIQNEGPVELPKVKPLEAMPSLAHGEGANQRKGAPRK